MSLRDIDAVVASKFMGQRCVYVKEPIGYYEDKTPVAWFEDYVLIDESGGQLQAMVHPGRFQRAMIPAYSVDVAAAMLVWEKLRESGTWCCLKLNSDYHYCWTVTLTRSELHGNSEHNPEIIVDGVEGGLDGLAYAICKAALRTISIEIPDDEA